MDLILDFIAYLRAVFAESQRLAFTAFDIVGIVLFFFPHLAEGLIDNEARARGIGGLIFFVSFLLANFTLYRKTVLAISTLGEQSLLLYPYRNPPYNDVEMRYVGPEPIKDLEVWLIYTDKSNEVKRKQIEEFFPRGDTQMIWRHFKANVLEENDIVRFHLLQRKSTADGRVTVEVSFVGAKTDKAVKVTKELELKL